MPETLWYASFTPPEISLAELSVRQEPPYEGTYTVLHATHYLGSQRFKQGRLYRFDDETGFETSDEAVSALVRAVRDWFEAQASVDVKKTVLQNLTALLETVEQLWDQPRKGE